MFRGQMFRGQNPDLSGHAVVRARRPADQGDRQSHRQCPEAICPWWARDQPAARRGHGRAAPAGGREQGATLRSIPAELGARGNVFYVWARSAPDSLVARNPNGKVVETYPINTARAPVFAALCKHKPGNRQGSALGSTQTKQP